MGSGNGRIDDETLLQRMSRLNPWWKTGIVPSGLLKEFRRRNYSVLRRRIDETVAQGVLGARQVGKTTMLYQLIADMLSAGADPRRILFLTLDGQGIAHSSDSLLRMFELYANGVIREPVSRLTKRVHVMIDEVHLVKGWQGVVKHFLDQAWPVKFVVSGSSAAETFAGSSESLVGRIRHQTLAAMSFAEYAAFKDGSYSEALLSAGRDMRAALDESARAGGAAPFYESVKRASLGLAASKDGLLAHLAEYMRYGGYPGIAARGDPVEKAEAIRAYIDLSLHKDAVRAGGVRNPALLDQLFCDHAWKSPHTVSRDKVSRNLGISRETVAAYGEILRRTFLVSYADFYTARPSTASQGPQGVRQRRRGAQRSLAACRHGSDRRSRRGRNDGRDGGRRPHEAPVAVPRARVRRPDAALLAQRGRRGGRSGHQASPEARPDRGQVPPARRGVRPEGPVALFGQV